MADQAMADLTDATLIRQILSGRSECYRPLVDSYKTRLYHLAYTLLGNAAEAQDIAQEAFLIAYKNLRDLKDRNKFGSWVYGITRNLCYEHLRKQKTEPAFFDDLQDYDCYNVVEMRPSDTSGADLLETLMAKLDSLPDKYRVLLTMKYLEDYSYQEIGEMLDIPVDLIRSRLFEGRRLLREELSEDARSEDHGV